jgi:hypothetical protein
MFGSTAVPGMGEFEPAIRCGPGPSPAAGRETVLKGIGRLGGGACRHSFTAAERSTRETLPASPGPEPRLPDDLFCVGFSHSQSSCAAGTCRRLPSVARCSLPARRTCFIEEPSTRKSTTWPMLFGRAAFPPGSGRNRIQDDRSSRRRRGRLQPQICGFQGHT